MYEEENDYELLYMLREKDDAALSLLIKKYDGLIMNLIRKYLGCFHDEDAMQEQHQLSLLKLLQAIEDYREDKETTFSYYFIKIIKYSLIDAYRTHTSTTGEIFYGILSMDAEIREGDLTYKLADLIGEDDSNVVISEELHTRYLDACSKMTTLEKLILDLRILGFSYQQIADKLHMDIKKVDNTIQKVRVADAISNDELTK